VNTLVPKFGLFAFISDYLAARRYFIFPSLILLLFLGLAGRIAAAGADVQNPPVTSLGPGPQFTIADFDGDLIPDLVSIEAGPCNPGNGRYWIQLRLSGAGRESIQLVAPAGGLQIEARDVNGDHAVDLVLATAWFKQPVAIFLNDGHGRFSRAEPTAFAGAFRESTTNWASGSNMARDFVAVPPQSRPDVFPAEQLPYPGRPARLNSYSSCAFLLDPFLFSHRGRAPPSEVPRV